RAIERAKQRRGDDHPATTRLKVNLAAYYSDHHRNLPDAETLYLEALESQGRRLGHSHDDTLRTHSNLALLYSLMDRPDAGFRHCLHLFEYRPTAPNVLNGMGSLIDRVSFETFT